MKQMPTACPSFAARWTAFVEAGVGNQFRLKIGARVRVRPASWLRALPEAKMDQVGESKLLPTRRSMLAFILFFLTIIFCISSLRSWLRDPVAFELFQLSRVVSAILGTFFFGSMIVGLSRRPDEALPTQARRILWQALCAALAVATVRLMIDSRQASDDVATLQQSGRWLLVWLGYYLAGCAAFLTLRYHHALADQRQIFAEELRAQLLEAGPRDPAAAAPSQIENPTRPAALWIDQGRGTVQVPIAEISRIGSEGNYVRVVHSAGAGLMRMPLSELETKLEPHGFIRVHRSALCNRTRIKALLRSKSGTLIVGLEDGAEVPVGRRYATGVTQLLRR